MIPLVLLPGLMCDARLFSPQIAAFSGDRSIISACLSMHASVQDMALSVLRDAPQRFALCGLSMGGIVAMEILAREPERVERVALLDTNPLAEADDIKARRVRQMMDARDGKLAAILRDELKPGYLTDTPLKDRILDLCMDMGIGLGPHVFLRQSRALMDRPDQTKTLQSLDIPSLVMCGRDDLLCPVERHELMADLIPGSKLAVIENAGHMPTLEQPELCNSVLARWLEEQ
jgi:pimeloyl-ACP methyl ester carboxylesterase